MAAIQNIVNEYGPAYLEKFGPRMPAEQRKVMDAIVSCRTSACGRMVYECTGCGKNHHIHRSCGNRHCPVCQNQKGLDWMERQIENALSGPYFMVTFTVPASARIFIRKNQRTAYGALFGASSSAMKTLAKDPKYIGGDVPGFFGILHTWGRTLDYHPHIHYVVPGGAWSEEAKQWRPSRPNFYLPVMALSRIYRAKFKELMVKADLIHQLPGSVWQEGWNVNIQAVGSAEQSIRYLSRYVFKVAISDHRIVESTNGCVTFKYRKPDSRRTRTMTVSAEEFIRRFLQHTLPSGFMKVRYYGFLNAACRVDLDEIRASIELMNGFIAFPKEPDSSKRKPPCCPECGAELRYCYSVLPYQDTG